MFKQLSRKLMLVTTLLALTIPASRAFSATTDPAPTPPPPSTSPSPAPSGVTGTDPEPIEPSLLELILAVLSVN
jgi:hypothetical protein